MLNRKSTWALLAVLGLAACGENQMVSRGAGEDRPTAGGILAGLSRGTMVLVPASYDVTRVTVNVPRSLRVSEANSFVPRADIVWHGDPLGDRYAQVQSLLSDAAGRATATMKTGQPVEVEIELTRFHALTPKARYTTGGNYATHVLMTVRDQASGEIIDGPRPVVADTWAAGGVRAMEEEAAGITQKVVIEQRFAEVVAKELSHRLVPKAEVAAQVTTRNAFHPGDLTIAE